MAQNLLPEILSLEQVFESMTFNINYNKTIMHVMVINYYTIAYHHRHIEMINSFPK